MPANDLDALGQSRRDGCLLRRGVNRAEPDAIRLQGDCLIDGGRLTVGGALAIDQTKLPTQCVAGFLDAIAHAECTAVALVLGWIDDEFAWLRRRSVGWTVPGRDVRRRCGNQCLGRRTARDDAGTDSSRALFEPHQEANQEEKDGQGARLWREV